MSVASNIYLTLNSFFGNPSEVVRGGGDERVSNLFETDTLPLMKTFLQYIGKDNRVLIVGCSEGVEIKDFADCVASVVAIDVNSEQ